MPGVQATPTHFGGEGGEGAIAVYGSDGESVIVVLRRTRGWRDRCLRSAINLGKMRDRVL